jgi:hypothetical protein
MGPSGDAPWDTAISQAEEALDRVNSLSSEDTMRDFERDGQITGVLSHGGAQGPYGISPLEVENEIAQQQDARHHAEHAREKVPPKHQV